ncbi:diguanylate cyclase regulator RdcB family protein [Vibrio metschnikovii]|uniref:diguanylate cyclase regulator RdcB family protein n=1 Tax=Vibrio metschnikovii TaxID=28172 RepID=UPI001C30B384|nr:diguanylate cyclase regulator RdcB family protein [Vibrio metschnikovii]
MSNQLTLNHEVCQLLTSVPEKFVVDLANSINIVNNITVAKDHVKIQRESKGFFKRLYQGVTGQDWQRQYEVNSSLIASADAQFNLLTDLCNKVALGYKAISKVEDCLNDLTTMVADSADFAVDIRVALEKLHHQVFTRFEQVELRLQKLEATQQVDSVFNKWKAGRFSHLPIASRAYAALEELSWGDFGGFIHSTSNWQKDKLMEDLSHRLIIQMIRDSHHSKDTRVAYRQWLTPVSESHDDYQSAIAYLSDSYTECTAPFITTLTGDVELPMAVPRICNAERLADALIDEVMGETR